MDTIEAILTRRSIRKYNISDFPEELLDQILKCAMHAPSANNQQSWEFIIINERKTLDRIPDIHPYAKMVEDVNVVILVCGNLNNQVSDGYWVQDCSAATQNILLSAHALGLGTVWLGVYPREERMEGLRKLFNLPDHIVPFSLIPVGFSNEVKNDPKRFDPDKIHYNKW